MPYSYSYRFIHRSKQPWRSRILQIVSDNIITEPAGSSDCQPVFYCKTILNCLKIKRGRYLKF
jgi:hypothetical protein